MIEPKLHRESGILEVIPETALTEQDFKQLAHLVDPYLEDQGKLNGLMIYADGFPGWDDMAAMASHFRFFDDHQRKIKRVAVVTDDKILPLLPKFAENFIDADVEQFPFDQRDQAISWLQS